VPEDAPEELDGPPERREEALATSSEENAAAGRLAYAVHADQLVSTRGHRVSALQPSLDEATIALIQAALSLTSSLRVPDALRRLVESACSITGASWGTIAVLNHADMDVDPAGPLSPDPSGASSSSVARALSVSKNTVNTYIARIRDKYRESGRPAESRVDLFRRAAEDGLVSYYD